MRASIAAILGTTAMLGYLPTAGAAEAQAQKQNEEQLEEVQVTGSRIVRKDLQSNSPLVSLDREKLDDNTYISVEQALNELPQFMAGGAGLGGATGTTGVGSLTGMETLDGGAGSGTMFDNARLPDNGGRVGTFTPGAANVNLRGLGTNRSLTLIDGHRGQPNNAVGTVDLNTIPQAMIANIEVITGGASAVYGADALAGVTNIRLRDNFEGMSLRMRGGVYEVGDGGEYQVSTVLGTRLAGKGNAMVGIEYSKRETSYYANRSWYREAMESPFSTFLNYSFPSFAEYRTSSQGTPTQAVVNSLFADRNCKSPSGATVQCISTTGGGGGFFLNQNGTANYVDPNGLRIPYGNATLFARSSTCLWASPTTATPNPVNNCPGQLQGVTYNYGPQRYAGSTGPNSPETPYEVTCAYLNNQPNTVYPDRTCAPSITMTDWGRWLSSPREAYNLFGRAKYELNDHLTAYSTISYANSKTTTRREASPASGGFAASIPYSSSVTTKYLPSIQQTDVVRTINGVPTVILRAGDTLPEFVDPAFGGTNTRGTFCPATGGCSMAQAFPVPTELRTLLNSRANPTRGAVSGTNNANTNPFQGLSSCINYSRNVNPSVANTQGAANFVNPTTGVAVTYQIDPNTGQPVYTCGPNATWSYNNSFGFIPPRGTVNVQRTWSLATGLEGDLPFKDWTWDLYTSVGEGQTNIEFQGFVSLYNYRTLMSQPNYGMGYSINAGNGKTLSCTSGLSPFNPGPISQDCIDAVASNQMDRQATNQRVHELSVQGGLFDLPAGEVRTALGASYRKNTFVYTPDSLRERDYINDTSPGQFGVGSVDAGVSVKEIYGELLVPLLRDLPGIQSLELELGARWSEYSTGQNVPTWKALMSWQPLPWVRARGGFNRAERAPNIAELYTKDSVNANGAVTDPCIVPTSATITGAVNGTGTTPLAVLNDPVNPDQAKLQALCAAQIARDGGNASTEFNLDPNNFGRTVPPPPAIVVLSGNPNLKSEKGSTWTAGVVVSSPFQHPLLQRMSLTADWYEARIDNPIDVPNGSVLAWACFNAYGDNPTYDVNNSYCQALERDPQIGSVRFASTPYLNRGKLVMRGLDASLNWSAALADMGLEALPGRLSIGINSNFLFDQIQALQAGSNTRDNAGIGNAARFKASTTTGYSWGVNRVSVNWQYRSGSCVGGTPPANNVAGKLGCATGRSRYPVTNTFSITGSTRLGPVATSLSVSNPLNKKPRTATYLWTDPTKGYGTFNPYDDITGRRYSLNLSMDF